MNNNIEQEETYSIIVMTKDNHKEGADVPYELWSPSMEEKQ